MTKNIEAAARPTKDASVPCQQGDAELWFATTPKGVALAKTLCRPCAIRDACLAGAIDRREPWGVWGGELFDQGDIIARKRPRGRPPKKSVAA